MRQSELAPNEQDRSAVFSNRRVRRAELLDRRMRLPEDEHRACSKAVLERLLSGFPGIRFERVGMYWPYLV